MKLGSTITATCIVEDGWPAAEITWFLSNNLSKSLNNVKTEILDSSDQASSHLYYTTYSELQLTLDKNLNNKDLVCRATHSGFSGKNSEAKLRLSFS